jgi:hypothetical protein
MWDSIETSLRRYATAWGRWAWAVVVGVILVFVELYLQVTNKPGLPPRVWLVLGFIVLALVPFIVFHNSRLEIESLKREVAKLRDSRPKVSVSADGFNLKVENTGGAATFEAKLRVLEVRNWPYLLLDAEFDAFWARKCTSQATILTHGDDRILLGGHGEPRIGVLSLYFYILNYQTPNHISTEYSLEQGRPRPFARLRVTILTNPSLDAPIVREVMLTPEGCSLSPPAPQPSRLDTPAPRPSPEG